MNRTVLHWTIRHTLRIGAGIALIALGIVGLILPLLPGWPFIASGIVLLWPKSQLAVWITRQFARIREWIRAKRCPTGENRQTDILGNRATETTGMNVEHEASRQGDHVRAES